MSASRATRRLGRSIWRSWSGYHRRRRIEAKTRCLKLLGPSASWLAPSSVRPPSSTSAPPSSTASPASARRRRSASHNSNGGQRELSLRLICATEPLFPRWRQATRTISACPSAGKRFIGATRMWISAVWRSGILAVGVACGDALCEGLEAAHPIAGRTIPPDRSLAWIVPWPTFASIRPRAWHPGSALPGRPAMASRGAQGLIAGARGRAVLLAWPAGPADRDDRDGVALDDGGVAAARVAGPVRGPAPARVRPVRGGGRGADAVPIRTSVGDRVEQPRRDRAVAVAAWGELDGADVGGGCARGPVRLAPRASAVSARLAHGPDRGTIPGGGIAFPAMGRSPLPGPLIPALSSRPVRGASARRQGIWTARVVCPRHRVGQSGTGQSRPAGREPGWPSCPRSVATAARTAP